MRLPFPSIGRRRVGRWCRGGETINDKWSYSMLPFVREERRGSTHFGRKKEHAR
jgi:hypothetical protein